MLVLIFFIMAARGYIVDAVSGAYNDLFPVYANRTNTSRAFHMARRKPTVLYPRLRIGKSTRRKKSSRALATKAYVDSKCSTTVQHGDHTYSVYNGAVDSTALHVTNPFENMSLGTGLGDYIGHRFFCRHLEIRGWCRNTSAVGNENVFWRHLVAVNKRPNEADGTAFFTTTSGSAYNPQAWTANKLEWFNYPLNKDKFSVLSDRKFEVDVRQFGNNHSLVFFNYRVKVNRWIKIDSTGNIDPVIKCYGFISNVPQTNTTAFQYDYTIKVIFEK